MSTNVSKLPAHKAPRTLDQVIEEVTHTDEALDIVFVADHRVACMGSGGALGHPKTFYTIGSTGFVECGYCDRVFVYDPEKAAQNS